MKINIITKKHKHYPPYLSEIAHPPKQLYVLGEPLIDYLPAVTIVGSRKLSTYGKEVTYRLAYDLAKQGITIVSGLALGADGIAHSAALDAGGRTVAVLAGGLNSIHPSSHRNLAIRLLSKGGTIISEYPEGTPPLKQNFVARNRLVAALSDLALITEAAERGGSLITARFALEQNKIISAIPGQITSGQSVGTNNLIRSGANLVSCAQDVLDLLGIQAASEQRQMVFGDTIDEQTVVDLMQAGITALDELQIKSALEPALFSQTITMLEISDKIRPLGGAHWTIK